MVKVKMLAGISTKIAFGDPSPGASYTFIVYETASSIAAQDTSRDLRVFAVATRVGLSGFASSPRATLKICCSWSAGA